MPRASISARRSAEPPALGHQIERAALAPRNAERPQRLRVEAHQLVVGALAEDLGDLGRAHRAEPRAVGGRVRAHGRQGPRHREVAADGLAVELRLRNVGNQPEPKLIASSASM